MKRDAMDRAAELAERYPSAREILTFYRKLLASFDARAAAEERRVPVTTQPLCPMCGEKPVAAVLRPEGDGAKRFLLCSQCLTEWEFRRLLCPNCGEESPEKLPVYSVEQYPHIRVEACDTCKVYLKAIDMTRDGLAVPEVDELASVAVDLWAKEKGYTKLQPNLMGL